MSPEMVLEVEQVSEEQAAALRRLVRDREKAKRHAQAAQDGLYAAMLVAFESGLGYQEIADATGLTRFRVAQVLRSQREKAA